MAKNTRAKTVDREHAYECRLIDGEPAWAVKYHHSQASPNPYARVKVSRGSDVIGHDMYVQTYQRYDLIDNPLAPPPAEPARAGVYHQMKERGGGLYRQATFTDVFGPEDFLYIECCKED